MITPAQPTSCVDFIAVADSLGIEGQETLSLSLSGPGNVLFGISTLNITITDADGTHAYIVYTIIIANIIYCTARNCSCNAVL